MAREKVRRRGPASGLLPALKKLEDREELAGELADVALYLLQLASLAGIDLEQAILAKLKRNYQRKWD